MYQILCQIFNFKYNFTKDLDKEKKILIDCKILNITQFKKIIYLLINV